MSELPQYYKFLRDHVVSAMNAFHAVEAAGIAKPQGWKQKDGREWTEVEASAVKTIETRLFALCEYAGVRSRQCAVLTDQVYALQEAAKRDRETIARLERALHNYVQEKVA